MASPSARAARQPKFSMWKVDGTGFSLAEFGFARISSGFTAVSGDPSSSRLPARSD